MNAISPALRLVSATETPAASRTSIHDVRGLVHRTMVNARAMGRDDLTQTREAASAVVSVRPDLTFSEALVAIGRLRAVGAV